MQQGFRTEKHPDDILAASDPDVDEIRYPLNPNSSPEVCKISDL
jgi:hypothetical protein